MDNIDIRTWVPFVRDNKQLSKTRAAMEKAASYLARAETGRGLDAAKTEQAINSIKNWKYWFVKNMASKENIQLTRDCNNRIATAAMRGKKVTCEHNGNHTLGERGAAALANNLFRMFYDSEVRAGEEPGITPFWTRDAGPVEFGESLSDEKHLPRQFAEAPTGPEYIAAEDEHAMSWDMGGDEFFTDDEIVEDEKGQHIVVDYRERDEKYFELRQGILHAKNAEEVQKVIIKARNLCESWTDDNHVEHQGAGVIANWMFHKIRYFASAKDYYERTQNFRVRREVAIAVRDTELSI